VLYQSHLTGIVNGRFIFPWRNVLTGEMAGNDYCWGICWTCGWTVGGNGMESNIKSDPKVTLQSPGYQRRKVGISLGIERWISRSYLILFYVDASDTPLLRRFALEQVKPVTAVRLNVPKQSEVSRIHHWHETFHPR
jgi:hypothetical protein